MWSWRKRCAVSLPSLNRMSPLRASHIIQSIGHTVAAQVHQAITSAGGNPALTSRVTAFVAQQAERIAA